MLPLRTLSRLYSCILLTYLVLAGAATPAAADELLVISNAEYVNDKIDRLLTILRKVKANDKKGDFSPVSILAPNQAHWCPLIQQPVR